MYSSITRYSLFLLITIFFLSCEKNPNNPSDTSQAPNWKGTLLYGSTFDVVQYSFDKKAEEKIIPNAAFPHMMQNGDIIYILQALTLNNGYDKVMLFKKGGAKTIELYNSTQAFLSLAYPRASTDGNLISLTNYDSDEFPVKGTLVFDAAGNIVSGFEDLYEASWTPDGRLIMAGTLYLGKFYPGAPRTGKNEGIFLSDKDLQNARRIDPDLTAPMSPSVSHDGKKVVFVLNDHLWTMNIDGTDLKQITKGNKEEKDPVWSPDGKYIACFCFGTFESTYYQTIAVVPSNPNEPTAMDNSANIWVRDQVNSGALSDSRVGGAGKQLNWY